jgi:hypothetical protein
MLGDVVESAKALDDVIGDEGRRLL